MSSYSFPRVIAVACQKGGSCKTTTSLNLGAALSRAGKRVLMIDLDPQGDLTLHCGHNPDTLSGSMYDVLKQGTPLVEVIRAGSAGPDVAPASLDLQTLDMEMAANTWRLFLVREAIWGVRERYDFIVIDTPPAMNLLTYNALQAAGEVVIPLLCEFFSLRGMKRLAAIIHEMQRPFRNPYLTLRTMVACRFDPRKRLARDSLTEIEGTFPGSKVHTIRENVSVAEASGLQRDVFSYAPKSNGAVDYMSLGQFIVSDDQVWRERIMKSYLNPPLPQHRKALDRYLADPAA